MKVLFVDRLLDPRLYIYIYPPLSALYLLAAARQGGHEVDLHLTRNTYDLDDVLRRKLHRFQPDVVALSLYMDSILARYNLIAEIKRAHPRCRVVVGGPHASALPARTLAECGAVDFLVRGEGERTFTALLDALDAGAGRGALGRIQGLCFRHGTGAVVSPPRALIEDLDSLPLPAYDLVRDCRFRDPLMMGTRLMPVLSTRGCPFDCTFCFKGVFGSGFRRRRPDRVADEVALLVREHGIDDISFADDVFAINRRWLARFFDCLAERRLRFPWKCWAKAGVLGADDFRVLRRHGCYAIGIGVETGNARTLEALNKRITKNQARDTIAAARRAGLFVTAHFIFGHPQDTDDTVEETYRFARRLDSDISIFSRLFPYPGTQVYALVPEERRYFWNDQRMPVLCDIEETRLNRMPAEAFDRVHRSFRYLTRNVVGSRSPWRFRKLKGKLWLSRWQKAARSAWVRSGANGAAVPNLRRN